MSGLKITMFSDTLTAGYTFNFKIKATLERSGASIYVDGAIIILENICYSDFLIISPSLSSSSYKYNIDDQ